MFFSTKDEFILNDGVTQTSIGGTLKGDMAYSMQYCLSRNIRQGKYLRYKSDEIDMTEEMLSRGAMFCNALVHQGYKNILFVGHFNDGQTHWMLDEFAGRMIDLLPPERAEHSSFPDMNIIAQSIPLVMQLFAYDINFTLCHPPESKYQGAMHKLYEWFSLENRYAECSQQYKHGQSSWTIDGEHEKFDAVVFLGVPMQNPEVGFEENQVREIFAPMCTPEFDMVDIYYGAPSSVKWFNGEEKDSKTMVDAAFALRSVWDDDMSEGRPEEYDIMHNMIKVF